MNIRLVIPMMFAANPLLLLLLLLDLFLLISSSFSFLLLPSPSASAKFLLLLLLFLLSYSFDLDDNIDQFPGAKWPRFMVRVGKALKRQSVSPQFYLNLFEVALHTIGRQNPEGSYYGRESWRR